MNRQELYRVARRNVETRRQRAETEAARRREEMERQVPGLLALQAQQGEAGAAAALLAASGNKQAAEEKLQLVQEIGLRRQKLLAQHGYAQEDFLPRYSCAICADSGVHKGEMCECVGNEARRLRREEINNASTLRLCRFENFLLDYYPEEVEGLLVSPRKHMQAILQYCMDYPKHFGPHSPSLLMFGDSGLGKTHLALSVAAEVLDAGQDVIYVSAQSAFAEISADRYSNESDLFGSMLQADLLVLDDLGIEYLDAYTTSRFYELVDGRMGRRPTIYTSNICSQEAFNLRYPEKITSRLLGDCEPMRFYGNDIRIMKRTSGKR